MKAVASSLSSKFTAPAAAGIVCLVNLLVVLLISRITPEVLT